MSNLASQLQTIEQTQSDAKSISTLRLIGKSFASHGILIAIVLSLLIFRFTFYPGQPDLTLQDILLGSFGLVVSILLILFSSLFIQSFYMVARYQKPKSATKAIFKQCWISVAEPRKALLGIPAVILVIVFTYAYVQIKSGIPLINPYAWDETFHNLDVWLHFGKAPWEWLHPIMSQSPYLVFLLNLNYNFWFFIIWMVFIPFAFSTKNNERRTQFLIAFFLVWAVGGGALATYFSSAGPAFYGKLGLSPDPYVPLMSHLAQVNEVVPVWAYELQNTMWASFENNGVNVGISAMPSIHNAKALLFVIAGWHLSKKMTIPLSIHCFFVYIGSFYLGWHYAVDAYLGWLVAIVAWVFAGYVARWWHKRPSIQQFSREVEALGKS